MSFARLHKWVTYLVAALGFGSLAIGAELGLESEIPLFLALALSWPFEGKRIHDRRWARGWTIALFAFFALQVLRGVLGGSPLALGLEAIGALSVSRLFNRRSASEYQQIGALALLQLIAATVLSTQLAYAFAFLGFVVVMPWTLALGHLRAEIEKQHATREDPSEATRRVLASPNLVGGSFLAGTTALSLPMFAITGLLFIAFPRVGLGFLSFGRDAGARVSGFGANVELGDFGRIRTDPTVILRVTPPGLPANPPERVAIRMRGTSFDHYDGRRWTRSRDLRAASVGRLGGHYPVPRRFADIDRDRPWAVVLDALDESVIFMPTGAVGIEVPPRVEGGVTIGRAIALSPGIDVRYTDGDGLGLRYTAWVAEDGAPLDADAEPEDADLLERYLQVPEQHERVAQLAERWTAGIEGELAQARAIERRLASSGEFEYSLDMPELGGRLPLDVFLFEARRGHCEYYATALAVMLRQLGIPSRNVTGFLGGRFNRFGGYYALAQGDAHSWVEAYVDGRWVMFDPTPGGREDFSLTDGWFGSLRAALDALRTRWSEDVVSYDLRSQIDLFSRVRRYLREQGGGRSEQQAESSSDAPSTERPVGIGSAVLVVAVLGLLGLLLWLLWRRRRAAGAGLDPHTREVVALYRSLEAALASRGHPRPADRTAAEHLASLEEAGFDQLETAREVTEAYLGARFGAAPLPPEERKRLASRVAQLR